MHVTIVGLPPTTNNLYAVIQGVQVLTETGRLYHRQIAAVAEHLGWTVPDESRYAVAITYYLGSHDRDVDGSQKALIDGLTGKIWHDDRQLQMVCLRKRRVSDGMPPYTSIVIRRLREIPPSLRRLPTDIRDQRAVFLATSLIPPTTNNTYVPVEDRRIKGRPAAWASMLLRREMQRALNESHGMPETPWHTRCTVRIRYYLAADRRDVDGSHKLVLDAARGLFWDDDSRIVHVCLSKGKAANGETPLMLAWFWPLTGDVEEEIDPSPRTLSRRRTTDTLSDALSSLRRR